MKTIVGFVRKTGEFEKDGKKIAYDNYNVYFTDDNTANVVGMSVGEVKCPVAKLKIFGADDLVSCIGRNCELYVDSDSTRYKNTIPVVTTIFVS